MECKFSVGDRIRVLSIEELIDSGELCGDEDEIRSVSEYAFYYILFKHGPGFVKPMEKFCGKTGILRKIRECVGFYLIEIDFDDESLDGSKFNFSSYMIALEEEVCVDFPDVNQLYVI